jgi:hypothetical protein
VCRHDDRHLGHLPSLRRAECRHDGSQIDGPS